MFTIDLNLDYVFDFWFSDVADGMEIDYKYIIRSLLVYMTKYDRL